MFEDLETVLAPLEQGVENIINQIQQLRQGKQDLESQMTQLSDELGQRDKKIEQLETQVAQLEYAESELETLNAKREDERQEAERERAEIRIRLEGIIELLNGFTDKSETADIAPESSQELVSTSDTSPVSVSKEN